MTGGAGTVYRESRPPLALADRVACVWSLTPAGDGRSRAAPAVLAGGGAERRAIDRDAAGSAPGRGRSRGRGPAAAPGGAAPGGRAATTDVASRHEAPIAPAGPPEILPDGCVDLVWHAGRLTVAGPDRRARPSGPGAGAALGVRLRPGAATTVGESAAALLDREPLAGELWGAEGSRLAERVAEAPDDRARLALLVGAIARKAADARPTDPLVDGAVALLTRGGASVGSVAAELGVGERLLRRRFADHVGYAPKLLDRVLRLQRVLRLAIATDEDLVGLAALAGYADQSHLTHETRALTGTTPAVLVASRRPG